MKKWIVVTVIAVTIAVVVAVVLAAKHRISEDNLFDMLDVE
jgi:predicted small secreted protein